MKQLSKVLQIHQGVTAFVGGGGKTSTIYELAKELSIQGYRVIVTTTTKMYVPTEEQVQALLIHPEVEVIQKAFLEFCCIGIGGGVQEGKILGVAEENLEQMRALADYVLVEADGSKRLPIKVHGKDEPVIPQVAEHVVAVVGMSGLGKKLEDCCFRKEEAMALLGVNATHIINADDLVKVITDSSGLRKKVGGKRFTVLLNQMDVIEDEQLSQYIVREITKNKTDQVVLASLKERRWC